MQIMRLTFEGWLECMGRCALGLYGPIELLKLHHLVDCILRNVLQSFTIEATVDSVWLEVRGDIRIWNVEAAAKAEDAAIATGETPSVAGSKQGRSTSPASLTKKAAKKTAPKRDANKGAKKAVGGIKALARKGSLRAVAGMLNLEEQWLKAKDAEQSLAAQAANSANLKARAATAIQAAWRRKVQRQLFKDARNAAIRIQSVLRGRIARRKLKEIAALPRRKKEGTPAGRQGRASSKPAAAGVKVPKKAGASERKKSAVAVNGRKPAAGEAKKSPKREAGAKKEEQRAAAEAAAVKVQANVRGHLQRNALQLEQSKEEEAAVHLQAATRGMLARQPAELAAPTPPAKGDDPRRQAAGARGAPGAKAGPIKAAAVGKRPPPKKRPK